MIRGFAEKQAAAVWRGDAVPRFPVTLQRIARRKLRMLNAASSLDELRVPPGNRLEALSGNRRGQFSIRINDQWRICFRWVDADAHDVEIVNYHR